MAISVIIPTYNGANKIGNLLQALQNQTYSDFEVVIVIDGSKDNTKEILNTFSNKLNLNIVSISNSGRAEARNIGAQNTQNDILVFFDDDMLPENNCIELHLEHHKKYSNSLLFGMARMHVQKDPNNIFYRYRYYIEEKWQQKILEKFQEITLENYSFTSCNFSIAKSTFNFLNGFDKSMNDSEDYDLSIRALLNGIKIYCNPKIWAWHADYATIYQYINRQIEYNKARMNLAINKPEYVKIHPTGFNASTEYKGIKRLIMKLMCYNSMWKLFLNSILFRFLSRKNQFKIYSLIIFSSSYHHK